jgi:hypothetical protein
MFTDYGMPVTFYNDHYDLLISQDYLFARKISPEATGAQGTAGRALCPARISRSRTRGAALTFLTGRGRIGRRFGTRFWERESTLGPDRELLMLVCKKWHVAKRMLRAAEDRLQVPGSSTCSTRRHAPARSGRHRAHAGKRNRHRRALMRMLFDYYDTDRLMICLDPATST